MARYGVRANPPRSQLGSLPLVGRVSSASDGDAEVEVEPRGETGAFERKSARRRNWWYVGGLGARGLVYHGMLGAIVAEAALTGDDACVPPELRFDPRAKDEGDE